MSIQVPYRWARDNGLRKADAYRVARSMATHRGSFTDAMIACGFWTSYKVWVIA